MDINIAENIRSYRKQHGTDWEKVEECVTTESL